MNLPVWEYKLFLVLTVALSEPPLSHYTLPFSPTLKARVCSSDDTHLFPVSTPVLLSTPVSPAPPPPALPGLAAARGSVISRLVIITELSWEQRRRERLRSSHRSQTATRSSGGCGRRWWPRSRWCGWRGCCRRRTSCWSRTRNISSPPDGHREC